MRVHRKSTRPAASGPSTISIGASPGTRWESLATVAILWQQEWGLKAFLKQAIFAFGCRPQRSCRPAIHRFRCVSSWVTTFRSIVPPEKYARWVSSASTTVLINRKSSSFVAALKIFRHFPVEPLMANDNRTACRSHPRTFGMTDHSMIVSVTETFATLTYHASSSNGLNLNLH